MAVNTSRTVRALKLLVYLRAHPDANARDAASEFKVSTRTNFRDLELLRAAGVEATWEQVTGRFRVVMPPGFDQLPVLDRSELVALLAAAQQSPLYRDPIVGHLRVGQ